MCCELGYSTVCPLVVARDNFIKWLHIVGLDNESRAGYAVETKRGMFFFEFTFGEPAYTVGTAAAWLLCL